MISRRLFWVADAALIGLAFVSAHFLSPALKPLGVGAVTALVGMAPSLAALRPESGSLPSLPEMAWVYLVFAPTALLTLMAIGGYAVRTMSRTRVLLSGSLASLVGLSISTLILFSLRLQTWSRFFLFTFAAASAIALVGIRLASRAYYQAQMRRGYYVRNVLGIAPLHQTAVLQRVVAGMGSRHRLAGCLQSGFTAFERTPSMAIAGGQARRSAVEVVAVPSGGAEAVAVLGSVSDLESLLVRRPIHEVLVVVPVVDGHWVSGVLASCDKAGVSVRLVPEALIERPLFNLHAVDEPLSSVGPGVYLSPRDWDTEALQVKRLVDVVVAAVALVVLSPIFALLAIAVRLSSPGPIFYRWHVVGQNGQRFVGYKFRTMASNADAMKQDLLRFNEMQGPVFKMANDPRIAPLGRWLRKYSLDELPQLYSVLKGDMSLVGPRPAAPSELERYEFWHMRKLSIRPGITCLWQVRGRNVISSFDEWVQMDLEYIDNWSLWLDLKILTRTMVTVARGTGR